MALIRFGGGVTDARGSVGGTTFSRNTYGAYQRARVTPTNPNTSYQSLVRARLAGMVLRWQTVLTLAQRQAWNTYGAAVAMTNKLGETIKLSGFNHYIRSNVPRRQNSVAAVDAGPTTLALADPPETFTISPTDDQAVDVAFDNTEDWAGEAGGYLFVYGSLPHSAGKTYIDGPYQLIGKVTGSGTPPTSPATLTWPFPIGSGQLVRAYARVARADGRLSTKVYTQAEVEAA